MAVAVRRVRVWFVALVLVAAGAGGASAGVLGGRQADAAAPSPYLSPGISPPGANDWHCRSDAKHPYPVVLVHGTFGDMTVSWNSLAPKLAGLGYCVYALDYGQRGTGPIPASAKQLGAFVDRVLSATGARKVLIVGHSQGGMMPRYWMRFLGGAAKTAGLVGLSPSNHGTRMPLTPLVGGLGCEACLEQIAGSQFLQHLNAGGDTLPAIRYTVIETFYDEVVMPYTSEFLHGSDVTNVVLQSACPFDPTDHVGIIYDPVALQWVVNALAHGGRADPRFAPSCSALPGA